MPIDDERLAAELSRLYWHTDASVGEIADQLSISRRALYEALIPEPAGAACELCGADLVFTRRADRNVGHALCSGCGFGQTVAAKAAADTVADAELAPVAGGAGPGGAEPEIEQDSSVGPGAPIDTEAALRRTRALMIGGLALAGAVVGGVIAALVRRR